MVPASEIRGPALGGRPGHAVANLKWAQSAVSSHAPRQTRWSGKAIGEWLGFHVYCLSKPCNVLPLDLASRAQPENLVGTAGAVFVLTAVAFGCSRLFTQRARASCTACGCALLLLCIALLFTVPFHTYNLETEIAAATQAASILRMADRSMCERRLAHAELGQRCQAHRCPLPSAEPESKHHAYRMPAACLAANLSRSAMLVNERGIPYPRGGLPRPKLTKRKSKQLLSRLPPRVSLRLGVPSIGLCEAVAQRQRQARVLLIGDSRVRNLAQSLVQMANSSTVFSYERYNGVWAKCAERRYRYTHALFCARAPPAEVSLCGGGLLLSYRACWLLELPCMTELPVGGDAGEAGRPWDLLLINAGLHDFVDASRTPSHQAYMVHRLGVAMRTLHSYTTNALWLTSPPTCETVPKGGPYVFWRPPEVSRAINQRLTSWDVTAVRLAAAHGWGVLDFARLTGHCEWSYDNIHFEWSGHILGPILARVIAAYRPSS